MNLFYSLPNELQSFIYEYDGTFREIFDEILLDIFNQSIFSLQNSYLIFDKKENISYMIDNLTKPTYLCIRHEYDVEFFENCKMNYIELNPVTLHLNLSLSTFEDLLDI